MASPPSLGPSIGSSRVVNMLEANTHRSRLVEAIETGAEAEVGIARNGRPVAGLTSLQAPARPRRLGIARGQFVAPDSINAPNPLIAELFEHGRCASCSTPGSLRSPAGGRRRDQGEPASLHPQQPGHCRYVITM